MSLAEHAGTFSIRVRGVELMNSRNHASEDELGKLAAELAGTGRILIGGLGLGYTLRSVLDHCRAEIDLVELVPVVRWARTHTSALSHNAVDDPRVTVIEDDVANVIARSSQRYAAIVLDVDNGPDEVIEGNARLYTRDGLAAAKRALAPKGALVVWSAFESNTFTRWLREVGFAVEVVRHTAFGARHFIWLART